MRIVMVGSKEAFLGRARTEKKPIRVLRTTTLLPETQSRKVVMRPALVFEYSIAFSEQTTWVYKEVVPASDNGQASLRDTLWYALEKRTEELEFLMEHRSGTW